MKRRVFKWLSTVLAVVMLMGLIVLPASASGSCNGSHSWGAYKWVEDYDNCVYGKCEVYERECSVCHAVQQTAFRSLEDHRTEMKLGDKMGDHTWGATESYPSECQSHPTTERRCTKCGVVEITAGGHEWTEGQVQQAHACEAGTRTDTCKYCKTQRTVNISATAAHQWDVTKTVQPTCTENGYQVKTCRVCGATVNVPTNMTATGHHWVNDDNGVCGTGQHCDKCGATQGGAGHDFGSKWYYDSAKHWQQCRNCDARTNEYEHDFVNGKCATCGYTKPVQTCSHDWQVTGSDYLFSHNERCSKCGATRRVDCYENGNFQPRTYCTDPIYCVCGNKVADGQKRHNFGTWICHDETHEHHCLNRDCQYKTEAVHTYTTVAGMMLCSVCKYVDKAHSTPHTHSFGAWTVGSAGCVAHCSDPTCTETKTTAHVPGAADCAGNAVCVNCGAKVTTTPSSTHGPTEIRNAKAAEVGVAGYSGDTWCLTCNKVIATGHAIEALKPSHVHTYTVKHDSGSHWQECECGARQGAAAHSYVGGVCSCGEKEPVKAPAHTHSYAAAFKSDSEYHWHECTSCGEKIEREEHLFIDGKCACGMTYGNYEAMVGVKDEKNSVVNVFSDVKSEGFYTLSVQRMYDAHLMSGKSSTFFDVNGTANRKEFMSVLARLNKVPGSNVSATWDTVSVNWCVEKGYAAKGDVNARVTRAEIVTILWKMAGKPSVSYDISKFTDSDKLTGETLTAMKWAVASGIMYGRGNTIQPESDANRGEIASFVARYIDLMDIDEKV